MGQFSPRPNGTANDGAPISTIPLRFAIPDQNVNKYHASDAW